MASTTKKTWETFLRTADDLGALQTRAEVPLALRDLTPGRTKYRMRHVVAEVSSDPEAAGVDELRVRTVVGVLLPQRWGIRIVRELPVEIPGTPYRHFFEALRAAAAPEPEPATKDRTAKIAESAD
jgi:hypothetical protein